MNLEEARSEATPLIRRQALRVPTTSPTFAQHRHQLSAYPVIPLLCGARFVAAVTSTPKIQVIRQLACRWSLAKYDPEALPSETVFRPEGLCDTSSVDKAFSLAILTLAVIDALGGVASAGIISSSAARYGRKRVMLSLTILVATSTVCFIAAVGMHNGALQDFLLLASVLLGALCGPMAFSLVCNMYVVDTTEPHERTFMLNLADGFAVLGTVPTYWLGGYLSRQFDVVTVFCVKLIATMPLILYILLFLPESLPLEKRTSPILHRGGSSCTQTPRTGPSAFRQPLDAIGSVFAPLKVLRPSREAISGRSDSRLLMIGLSQFLNTLGSEYVGNAFVTYTAVRFHIGLDPLAIALGGFAVSQMIWLSLIVPTILCWGRPFRDEHRLGEHSHDELETRPRSSTVAGHRFDIYFAVASSILGALASTAVGLAPSSNTVIAAFIMFSLGMGHDPTTRNIMVTSVDPLHSDDALSALTIINSIGALLAPLVFGPVLSSSITQFPGFVFFLCSATILFAGTLLLFVQALEEA